MKKLSEKEYWDSVYKTGEDYKAAPERPAPVSRTRRALRALKTRLSSRTLEGMASYRDYLFWSVLLRVHLPPMKGARVLEVGSAPGDMLVEFSRRMGVVPFGVEYAEEGVAVNRRLFKAHGLNPDNVIHSDLFEADFQSRYRGAFDLVYSGGFIEHFSDPSDVVEKHLNLLADGGYLIIMIPNLRGLNYALTSLFARRLIAIHNLTIMRLPEFRKLFDDARLMPLACGYFGGFSFDLFSDEARPEAPGQKALAFVRYAQPVLNLAFRRLFGDRCVDTAWTSQSLIYIGRKRPLTTEPAGVGANTRG
jgi:SAM-dependent methyltransferase